MFGIIFGKDNLFSLSYLKPDSIEDFNQRFNYIFQTEFLMEDSAFEIFCLKLKECTDLRKKLKLEEVLLKCFYLELKQRCDQDLNKAIETWKLLKASTLHFTDEIMNRYKNNSKIEFFKIYSEIEQYILDKTKKNTMNDSSTLPFN